MCANIACIAAVLLGIDVGWKPLPEGGTEYLIQIEPNLLETLKSGEPILSDVPPYVKDVRSYRITVGTGELPRELPPESGVGGQGPEVSGPSPSHPLIASPPHPFTPSPFAPPNPLEPDPGGKPITAQQAVRLQPADATPKPDSKLEPEATAEKQSQEEAQARPWKPLILTLLGLFASLGTNGFLLWIAADFRNRYRALLRRMGDTAAE